MQNITGGANGVLPDDCINDVGEDRRHLCMLSPRLQQHVESPFFLFTSSYDSWQLRNILGLLCVESLSPDKTTVLPATHDCNRDEQKILEAFNDRFLLEMAELSEMQNYQHGAIVTSCICHDCPWEHLVLDGKTGVELYVDWYNGVKDDKLNFHMDSGPSNGGGKLLKFDLCLEVALPFLCKELGGTKYCLTREAWAGIIVGIAVFVLLLTMVAVGVFRHRRRRARGPVEESPRTTYNPPKYKPVAASDSQDDISKARTVPAQAWGTMETAA